MQFGGKRLSLCWKWKHDKLLYRSVTEIVQCINFNGFKERPTSSEHWPIAVTTLSIRLWWVRRKSDTGTKYSSIFLRNCLWHWGEQTLRRLTRYHRDNGGLRSLSPRLFSSEYECQFSRSMLPGIVSVITCFDCVIHKSVPSASVFHNRDCGTRLSIGYNAGLLTRREQIRVPRRLLCWYRGLYWASPYDKSAYHDRLMFLHYRYCRIRNASNNCYYYYDSRIFMHCYISIT